MNKKPSVEEIQELIQFVETLPRKIRKNEDDDPFPVMLAKYNADPMMALHIINGLVEDVFAKLKAFSEDPDLAREELKDPLMGPEKMLLLTIQSALMQMFIFASEYSLRWVLPDLLAELKIPEDLSSLEM